MSALTRPSESRGRDLQGVAQAFADPLADDEAIDDDVDVVALVLVQGDFVGQVPDLAVHLHPHVALAAKPAQLLLELALLAAHDGGQERDGRASGQRQELLQHGVDRLRSDLAAALEAVGRADAGVEETQVVVDLRDGAHRRPGVVACASLLDGDGRREPLDGLHLGLVHLADELAGIGGQGLHVAALALGVDRVEGKRRLARAAHAGDDDETVPGDVDADVLEVVLRGTLDANVFHNDQVDGTEIPLCIPLLQRGKEGDFSFLFLPYTLDPVPWTLSLQANLNMRLLPPFHKPLGVLLFHLVAVEPLLHVLAGGLGGKASAAPAVEGPDDVEPLGGFDYVTHLARFEAEGNLLDRGVQASLLDISDVAPGARGGGGELVGQGLEGLAGPDALQDGPGP